MFLGEGGAQTERRVAKFMSVSQIRGRTLETGIAEKMEGLGCAGGNATSRSEANSCAVPVCEPYRMINGGGLRVVAAALPICRWKPHDGRPWEWL